MQDALWRAFVCLGAGCNDSQRICIELHDNATHPEEACYSSQGELP